MTDNFIELRIMARLNRKQAAELFEVTELTIINWDKEKIKPYKSVLLFLKLRNGDLSFLGKKWRGFYLSDDCIESPNGDFERYKVASMLKQRFDESTEERIFDNFNKVKLKAVK